MGTGPAGSWARGMAWALALVGTAALVFLAVSACALGDEVSEEERRTQQLNKGLMCPVCPGESIDQSQNELAAAMREIVARQVREGRTDEEIEAYFVESYGESVLMEPPREGFSLLVWLLPPAAAAGALAALVVALVMMSRSSAPGEAEADDGLSNRERADYYRRIEGALEHDRPSEPDGEAGKGKA